MPRSLRLLPFAVAVAVLLAGCESREEKARRFFESGMALLEAGDEDRALLEFRNVFQYDGFHKEARETYAGILLERGETADAYGQFLRLIEQYPDTPQVRETLAEIAIGRGDWEEAVRHGEEAIRLAPDRSDVQAIDVALRYRTAVLDEDEALREEIAREARVLLAAHPDLAIARRIAIDWLASGPNPWDALPEIDLALAEEPNSLELHVLKFRILAEAGDAAGTGAQLQEMYERFPDNQEVREGLIRWYLAEEDVDGAEAFLRDLAGDDTGPTEGHVTVVQFLQALRGDDAALAELDRLIAANGDGPNADLYRALRAGLDFDAGRRDEAIAAFEAILETAEPSDQTRKIKGMLARMLSATGNQVGARQRVEEILAEDATNAEALRLRAAWAIAEDRPGEAIVDLRTALSQDPRDVNALTLMAEAHERDGSLDLAGERLALAVEVSNAAPEPSLRYADFLIRQGRDQVAEAVLTDSQAANPESLPVALRLADIWLRARDFDRVEQAIEGLAALGTSDGERAAESVRAAMLLAQDRTQDGLDVLESIAAGGDEANLAAIGRILDTMIRDGQESEARVYLDAELAKAPDSRELRLMDASLKATMGDLEAGEAGYRALIAENPDYEAPIALLYELLRAMGRPDEATAALDAGLAALPDSARLRWVKAGELELGGDIDGAIAIYEELYAENSGNVVVANNLASLLGTHRDDDESLDRAFVVARRLRGSDQPAFQDTYGWIAYRRGDLGEALSHLEPAAAGLAGDPMVQFHLGMTYAGLGRTDDAVRQLERAIELGGDAPLPQLEEARATLAELREAPATGVDGGAAPESPPAEEAPEDTAGDGTEGDAAPEAPGDAGGPITDAPGAEPDSADEFP